jgi:hypothetical protein
MDCVLNRAAGLADESQERSASTLPPKGEAPQTLIIGRDRLPEQMTEVTPLAVSASEFGPSRDGWKAL